MRNLTTLFKALGDRNRLRVVAALLQYEELCACQIMELMEVAGATVSRHMALLISSGLVDSRKEGRWVYYRLCQDDDGKRGLIQWLRIRLAEDDDAARDAKTLTNIMSSRPEDICRMQRGGS